MDSPAPEQIPLPPVHWFTATDLMSTPSRARTSPTPSSVSSEASSSSFEEKSSVSSSDEFPASLVAAEHRGGFRVNPLQLIAAVSAIV